MLYDSGNPIVSASELVYAVKPEWKTSPGHLKITSLVGGVPNTVRNSKTYWFKCANIIYPSC